MTCADCRRYLEDFENYHLIDGRPHCIKCTPCCPECGEWMDDEDSNKAPHVKYKRWELRGELSPETHADCAADWLLSVWCGHAGKRGAEDFSAEEIADIVHAAFLPEPDPFLQAWKASEVHARASPNPFPFLSEECYFAELENEGRSL